MPYKYKLTSAEKAALKREYLENIRVTNEYIAQVSDAPELQIKPNLKAFEKRINDPGLQRFYKKSLEIKEREEHKNRIATQLIAKYKYLEKPGKQYLLNRVIHSELIPSEDPAAMKYNEAIIKQYYEHPEAVLQRRFQKVLNANVKELVDMSKLKGADLDNYMLDYAADNPALVEDAFELNGKTEFMKNEATPETKSVLGSVTRNYESVSDTSLGYKKMGKWFFTVDHKLTQDQDFAINGTDYSEDHKEMSDSFAAFSTHGATYETSKKLFVEFWKGVENLGIDVKKDGALTEVEAFQMKNNKKVLIGLPKMINKIDMDPNDPDPVMVGLKKDQVDGIKKMFKKDYTKEPGFKEIQKPLRYQILEAGEKGRNNLVHAIALQTGRSIVDVDSKGIAEFAKGYAGNLKERLLGTTSQEWKDFTKSLEDFENPNDLGYCQTVGVKQNANRYLMHKGVKTLDEALRLKSPGRERAVFCIATIQSFEKAEPESFPRYELGTLNELPRPKGNDWPPAIEDSNLIEDKDVEKENVKAKEPTLEEVLDMADKDISN